MGNATGLASYEILTPAVEYSNSLVPWTINNALSTTAASTKDYGNNKYCIENDMKESVCIFRLAVNKQQPQSNETMLAQKAIQRLKVFKHPYVLKFVENAESTDGLALVTESCVPLETWLKSLKANQITVQLQEIMWGLKCILLALNFLHSNCSMIHGNLGLQSIFVVTNGDWKLGGMDLVGNMSMQAEADHFAKFQHLLDREFVSPERNSPATLNESLKSPFPIDIYSFGKIIQRVFNDVNIEMPRSFGRYLTSMLQHDTKKRPSAAKLCQSSMFHSEDMLFIESIGELSLKSPKEFLEVISKMEDKLTVLSKPVCAHKILPNIARSLQIAMNDFPLRDAREGCRQSVQVSVTLLTQLATNDKLDQSIFRQSCLPVLVQLWSMTDRTVRTVMLQSLKALIPFVPDAVINRTIFDHMMAGFSDSNAKLRESTLMSLIFVVDKLEEPQLQDKLVRCIINLQNDVEHSIRTNSTIFLGKIAGKLKEAVRTRVLCVAFQKAMKDPFLHCRIAGLKTSNACIKLLDVAQIATRIMPQASLNALDGSSEVRALALILLQSCISMLRKHNEDVLSKATAAMDGSPTKGAELREVSSSKSSEVSSWSSWSMLQGLSKTLESATLVGAADSSSTGLDNGNGTLSPNASSKNFGVSSQSSVSSDMDEKNKQSSRNEPLSFNETTVIGNSGWDDEVDLDAWDDAIESNARVNDQVDANAGWDDDLDELHFDDAEETEELQQVEKVPVGAFLSRSKDTSHAIERKSDVVAADIRDSDLTRSSMKSLNTNRSGASDDVIIAIKEEKKIPPKPKVSVKKLSVSKDDDTWDDF